MNISFTNQSIPMRRKSSNPTQHTLVMELCNHKLVTVTSDFPPSPHQTTSPPQSDVGEHAHTSVQLSHPPTPLDLDICADLACKNVGCHLDLFPQPPSPCSIHSPDCTILCSYVPDSTCILNEDQAFDGVDVVQPTCDVFHDECVWEYEHETVVKDDLPLSTPPPLFPDISGDSSISNFPCINSSTDVSTSDHS